MLNRKYEFCNNLFSLIATPVTRHGVPYYVVVRLNGRHGQVIRSAMSEPGVLLQLYDELRKAEEQQREWKLKQQAEYQVG